MIGLNTISNVTITNIIQKLTLDSCSEDEMIKTRTNLVISRIII